MVETITSAYRMDNLPRYTNKRGLQVPRNVEQILSMAIVAAQIDYVEFWRHERDPADLPLSRSAYYLLNTNRKSPLVDLLVVTVVPYSGSDEMIFAGNMDEKLGEVLRSRVENYKRGAGRSTQRVYHAISPGQGPSDLEIMQVLGLVKKK